MQLSGVRLSIRPVAAAEEQLWHSPVAGNRAAVTRSHSTALSSKRGSAVFTAKGRGWTQTCYS